MKFTVLTSEFKEAMAKIEKALPKKAIVPVLENVKISIDSNSCFIYATDLEQFVKTEVCLLRSNENGSFVFYDTKSLIKAMKFFKNPEIEFDVGENSVSVKCGDKKANLKTLDADYPEFPVVNDKLQECNYSAKKLSKRYNTVKYAVSKSETKPILTGIHFDKNNMVTCDGFRLSINTDDEILIQSPFTAHINTLHLCDKILDGNIMISYNKKYIQIKDNSTTIIGRLFDGEYIDYNRVIPNNNNMIKVDTKNFTENLKYLKTFVGNKYDYIAWKGDCLKYQSHEGEYEANIEMQGEFSYTIGFNVNYMLDCLTQFEDEIEVYIGDSNLNPMLFKQGNNTALVLPCRLKEDPFTN